MARDSAPHALRTRICDVLGIAHPVVMGGMAGGYTSADLVAAVSNAGGLGTLGVSSLSAGELTAAAGRIRDLTARPFALNLLLFTAEQLLAPALVCRPAAMAFSWAAADQRLDAIFARAHDAGCKVIYQAPTVREARRGAKAGADVVVAQGGEGGGHIGVMGTMPLVPMIVDAVRPLPVLAAGGIADGRGLAAAIALGADGVLIGTRLLATVEASIHPNFKQAIVESDGHDTDVSTIPDLISGRVWPGALARARRNALIGAWSGRERELREQRASVAERAAAAREAGDAEWAVLYYGQDAGLIRSIEPAGDVIRRMVRDAGDILRRAGAPPAAD
jgi:NAD(P)H-dependent flavin oxidoreductase YrpB (nitropropane dioxygenase family)